MARSGGFVCYGAPPPVLRREAVRLARLDAGRWGMDYHYLAREDGEVQIFRDYRRQLSQAAVARREVRESLPEPVDPETLRWHVWKRKEEVRQRAG
jgi:hypothetical protein